MPAGDRTGPRGEGPRTGRGLGYCSGYTTPGYTKGVPRGGGGFGRWGRGPGYGRGFGFGRGYRAWAPAPRSYPGSYGYGVQEPATEEEARQSEKEYLEGEVEALEEELDAMRQRMRELDEENNS